MIIDTTKLLNSQSELIRAGFIKSHDNWIICAPTGAGKTRMAEWALQQAAENGRRGIFLAPLKAIVEEKLTDWKKHYPELQIGLYTGETTRKGLGKCPGNEQILLMTSEKLASYLHNWKRHLAWLAEIEVVVLDEFHLIGDPGRGVTVESLIGRLQRINPFVRLVGLSATIPNATQLGTWLKAKIFISTWRPVPLSHRIVRFRKATDKPQLLENEVSKTVEEDGQILVFVNSRRRSEQLAIKLQEAGFLAAFYHAGLDKDERSTRQKVMQEHGIDVLISTSSLEMGVNFPARKVVVYDSYVFNGETFGPLPIGRYLQCAGRAGRPGFDTKGESVLFLPRWHKNAEGYVSGNAEPIISGLMKNRVLQKEIITEVASRLSISTEHLMTNFTSRTFRHFINGPLNLTFHLERLLDADLIKRSGDTEHYLTETPLGRIATQMDVSPETIQIFDRFYRQLPGPCLFDCLLAVCLCPELTPKLPFYFEQMDDMTDIITNTSSHLLDAPPDTITKLFPNKQSVKTLLAAIKTAVVLISHTMGESITDLSERFDCYPMDLAILKKNCDWMFATALRVFAYRWRQDWLCEGGESADKNRPLSTPEKQVQLLVLMVKHGLSKDICKLVKIKGIGPKRALALHKSGITTLNDLVDTSVETISMALGLRQDICSIFQESAQKIIADEKFTVPFDMLDEPIPESPHEILNGWPQHVDPYRLRRALDLKIIHRSDECMRIEGGTEPHTIHIRFTTSGKRTYQCDCMDAAKGNFCKHVMRARLECGDGRELLAALQTFQERNRKPLRYALADIWIQGADLYDRYEERVGDYDGKRFLDRKQAAHRWNR